MKKWIPLLATQFMGILNDNLLKHLIIFIGVLWVSEAQQPLIIPIASALLILPFVLFSPIADRLAIITEKSTIVKWAKFAEFPIMLLAIIGFSSHSIVVLLVSLFLMGLQSAIYSPSKIGLIKDIAAGKDTSKGVGMMDLLGFIAVLASTILAGSIAQSHLQLKLTTLLLSGIAIVGWIFSLKINTLESSNQVTEIPKKKSLLPTKFISQSYKNTKKKKGLFSNILAVAGFWFIASLIQMNLLVYTNAVLALNSFQTSVVLGITTVGIGLGCFVGGVINKHRIELGISVFGAIGLAICAMILGFFQLSTVWFTVVIFFGAFFAGLYKTPLNSWMQERVKTSELPGTLAFLNMIVFLVILIASGIFGSLIYFSDSVIVFKFIGLASVIIAAITLVKLNPEFIRFFVYLLSKLLFKMNVSGIKNIPKDSGALIIANHFSFLDFILIAGAVPRKMRFVMYKDLYEKKSIKWLCKSLNMIPISPRSQNDLDKFNTMCQKEINDGHVVVIFAEGTVTRNGHMLEFKKGLEHIASGIDSPIIPIHIDDVIGSAFTFERGQKKAKRLKFNIKRKAVQISIGEQMPTDSSAFEVRQKVMELNAINLTNRVKSNATVLDLVKNNKIETAFYTDNASMNNGSLISKAKKIARRLKNVLGDEKLVALSVKSDIEHITHTLALSLLGKTVVVFETESNEEIIKKCIALNCSAIISNEKMMDNAILSLTPKGILRMKNKSLLKPIKLSKSDIALKLQNGDTFIDVSHENILTTLLSIEQTNDVKAYGTLNCKFPKHTLIYNLITVWLPLKMKTALDFTLNNKYTKTLIGLKDQIVTIDFNSGIKNVITNYGVSLKLKEKCKKLGVQLQTGFGLISKMPIMGFNTENFVGKDIAGKPLTQLGTSENSIGRPLPGIAVKIVDPKNTSLALAVNQPGLILVKGAQLMKEYGTQLEDWINTKVIGYMDEKGFVYLTK